MRALELLGIELAAEKARAIGSGVSPVAVAGLRPTACQVAQVEAELEKVPAGLRRRWREKGGTLELLPVRAVFIPGETVPRGGYCSRVKAIVAADHPEVLETCLHELAHGVDYIFEFSKTAEWLQIYELERHYFGSIIMQRPYRRYGTTQPYELFAEVFASFFLSGFTRSLIEGRPRQFIEDLIQRF
jgi:hypothetical protein